LVHVVACEEGGNFWESHGGTLCSYTTRWRNEWV